MDIIKALTGPRQRRTAAVVSLMTAFARDDPDTEWTGLKATTQEFTLEEIFGGLFLLADSLLPPDPSDRAAMLRQIALGASS